ncbi:MAG TPA: hypothetical protein VN965_10615 [Candidatus Dormibacteraeota bacterium]|nr:hypothetical protein [Candidatus Dormibacteraeota bacterium]
MQQEHRHPTDPLADPTAGEFVDDLVGAEQPHTNDTVEPGHRHGLSMDELLNG